MSIVIWGAGAIGGTIGAHLVRAGHDILFVDSDREHVAAMNDSGLNIIGPAEEFAVPVKAIAPEHVSGEFDKILLATKVQHTKDALEQIMPHLSAGGYVVSAQNGLSELFMQQVIGKERTIGALINFGADYQAPGKITYGGGGGIFLGEIDGTISERLKQLQGTLLDFDPEVVTTDNIMAKLWGKQVFAAIVFVTSLTNESVADSLSNTAYRDVYVAAAREIVMLAEKVGLSPRGFMSFEPKHFAVDASQREVDASIVALIASNRESGKTHSGIWRDLAIRKRKTEVAMFDVILAEGERLNMPLRFTRHWINMIREVEDGKRPLHLANLDELKSILQ